MSYQTNVARGMCNVVLQSINTTGILDKPTAKHWAKNVGEYVRLSLLDITEDPTKFDVAVMNQQTKQGNNVMAMRIEYPDDSAIFDISAVSDNYLNEIDGFISSVAQTAGWR